MNKIKTIVIGLILSALTTFAYAEFRVGITGSGVSFDDVKGSETTSNQTETDTLEAILPSIFVEKGFGPLTLGIDILPYKIEGETVTNDQSGSFVDQGSNNVTVDIDEHYKVYALLGLGDSPVYLKVAYTEADVLTEETMHTGSSYPNAELEGTYVGLGAERDLDNAFIRVEAGFSSYDDISVTGTGGDDDANTVTVSGIDGFEAKISIGKAF